MEQIYKDNIIDHYKHPRNFGKLSAADSTMRDVNTLCGDEIEFSLKFEKNVIADVKFTGKGCAISQASASMLSEKIKGKDIKFVERLKTDDVPKMLGIDLTPARMKCALLPLRVLKLAVYKFIGQNEHK